MHKNGFEQNMSILSDSFGRQFPYLRLSVTDVCNFRCHYCLPDGYQAKLKQFLTIEEIRRLLTACAELGMHKVRLTGGEPTIRKDLSDIIRTAAAIPGIQKIALTTNGYQLEHCITEFYQAGLHALNVSVDSLDRDKFFKITGHDRLPSIMAGISKAQQVGFSTVKINAVLMKGVNDEELEKFLALIKHQAIDIRFIELMQTGTNYDYFKKHHISADFIQIQLIANGWERQVRNFDSGPAIMFSHPDYVGKIGIIAPYSKDFCTTCNRLRVSAQGSLHLCLFTSIGYSLRPLLKADSQKAQLKQMINHHLQNKRISHFLAEGDTGINSNFSSIGG